MIVDDLDVLLTAEQYRERAKLERMKAAAMGSRSRRQELLAIAMEYEELADSIERVRLH